MKFFLRFFLTLLLLIVFSHVLATTFVFNANELTERVEARWETIIDFKFGETYDYETPAYKAVFTKDLYINQFSYGFKRSLTKIERVKYDPATGVATVIAVVETKPRNSKELDASVKTATVEIREKWLHIKGRWWHSSSE